MRWVGISLLGLLACELPRASSLPTLDGSPLDTRMELRAADCRRVLYQNAEFVNTLLNNEVLACDIDNNGVVDATVTRFRKYDNAGTVLAAADTLALADTTAPFLYWKDGRVPFMPARVGDVHKLMVGDLPALRPLSRAEQQAYTVSFSQATHVDP